MVEHLEFGRRAADVRHDILHRDAVRAGFSRNRRGQPQSRSEHHRFFNDSSDAERALPFVGDFNFNMVCGDVGNLPVQSQLGL